MPNEHDAVITGIGLVSSLGEGGAAHLAAVSGDGFRPVIDAERFPPFPLHPLPPIAFDRQIPKRGDLRQMETWQRLGTYAAGLALDQAGVTGQGALLERMEMIVAAGGGERDPAADAAILTDLRGAADPETLLNQRLLSDLRPTLFLAQLSNLLAGNISIVHGVVGGSRSFMGEEPAGADAVRVAVARIASGQGDLFLVGGAFAPARPEVLLHYEMGGVLWKQPWAPIWARQAGGGGPGGGMALGTLGCFLVIESRGHAAARGAAPVAAIGSVATDRCRRRPGEATANAARQLAALGGRFDPATTAVISGASGLAAPTAEERDWLAGLGLPVRAAGTVFGHGMEPAFPAAVALAALAVQDGRLFPPLEPAEAPMAAPLRQALVTGWGHWRGEALGLVSAA